VLLVVKVNRFSRRQRDLVALVEELIELGVAFVSATESFDTSTPPGAPCSRCWAPSPNSNAR
jgi:site-specific DNA recombinase